MEQVSVRYIRHTMSKHDESRCPTTSVFCSWHPGSSLASTCFWDPWKAAFTLFTYDKLLRQVVPASTQASCICPVGGRRRRVRVQE